MKVSIQSLAFFVLSAVNVTATYSGKRLHENKKQENQSCKTCQVIAKSYVKNAHSNQSSFSPRSEILNPSRCRNILLLITARHERANRIFYITTSHAIISSYRHLRRLFRLFINVFMCFFFTSRKYLFGIIIGWYKLLGNMFTCLKPKQTTENNSVMLNESLKLFLLLSKARSAI